MNTLKLVIKALQWALMQHFTSPHAVFISTQYDTTVVYRGGWYTANMVIKPCMQFKGMNS